MEGDTANRSNPFYTDSGSDSGRSENTRPRIDFSRADFPKPWFINNGKTLAKLETKFEGEVTAVEQTLGRPLNSVEREGMAYWSSKELAVRSRGLPLGFLAGACMFSLAIRDLPIDCLSDRAYATSKEFRFPFWKPSETFNPNAVRVFGISVLQGQLARAFWHTARYFTYSILVGPIVLGIFTSSWGVSVASLGRLRDPRTKPMFDTITTKALQVRREMTANRNSGQPLPSSSAASYDTDSPTNNEYGEAFPPDNGSDSPQSSQDPLDFASYGKSASNSSAANSYNPVSTDKRRFPHQNSDAKPTYQRPQDDSESSSFFDNNYDDASPIASYPSPSSSEGSAWDRIRAGKSANSGTLPRGQTANKTRQNESSASTEVDSRSQAQKDFDASLERERQGKNFD